MGSANNLADRINYAMVELDMSQADLARKSGLSTAVIAQIVTGKTKNPTFTNVVKIAKALNVSLNYLSGDVTYAHVSFDDEEKDE